MKIKLILLLTSLIYVNTYAQINSNDNEIEENVTTVNYVYPNPTSGILTIKSNTAIMDIEVYDMIGHLVYSKPIATGLKQKKIDITKLKKGAYFIKIEDENKHFEIQKIVKK